MKQCLSQLPFSKYFNILFVTDGISLLDLDYIHKNTPYSKVAVILGFFCLLKLEIQKNIFF